MYLDLTGDEHDWRHAYKVCIGLIKSAQWDRRHCRVDTRTQAAAWIEHNVESDGRVLLAGHPQEPAQLSVPLRDRQENVYSVKSMTRS